MPPPATATNAIWGLCFGLPDTLHVGSVHVSSLTQEGLRAKALFFFVSSARATASGAPRLGSARFRRASLGLSRLAGHLCSSSLPCGPLGSGSGAASPCAGSLGLAPSRFPRSGTLPLTALGRRATPAGNGFLGSLPPPWRLRCCARHGLCDGTHGARYSFDSSVHARLGGLSYCHQNDFLLLVHTVHLPLRVSRVSVTLTLGRVNGHSTESCASRESLAEFGTLAPSVRLSAKSNF
jgi:hypothetical protein